MKCNSCGWTGMVYPGNAKKQRMCRECRRKFNTKPKENLTGLKFGRLSVIRWVIRDNGHIGWECECDCGNTEHLIIPTSHLKSGHTQSCGCYMRERITEANSIDLTGKEFGKLTVVKKIKGHLTPKGQLLTMYQCECDCCKGKTVDVLGMNLVTGNTKSCGCLGSSYGEYTIEEYLKTCEIPFKKQYSFTDLLSSAGGRLRFDFGLLNFYDSSLNCLIEYNGEQHYYEPDNDKSFGKMQREETDALKKEYCDKNNIKLFTIRYDTKNIFDDVDKIIDYYYSTQK